MKLEIPLEYEATLIDALYTAKDKYCYGSINLGEAAQRAAKRIAELLVIIKKQREENE